MDDWFLTLLKAVATIAAIYIVLLILDFALPELWKRRINDAHINVWNALDNLKGKIRTNWLFNHRPLFALVAILVSLAFVAFELYAGELARRGWFNIPIYSVPILFGIAYGYGVLVFILRNGVVYSVIRAVFVFLSMCVLMFVIGYRWVWFDFVNDDDYGSNFESIKALFEWSEVKEYLIIQFLFYAQFTASMFFWTAVVPLLAVAAAQILVTTSEFILRRVAETREGAIAGWARVFEILKGG